MKTKTLITMAVAGTFGWSAGVFAGPHEVTTPFSPSESGSNIVQQHDGFHSRALSTAMGPTESPSEATGHELALSDSSDWSASFDQMAEADVSDVYLIGFAPMDSWDYYLIDSETGDTLALISEESYFLVPLEEVAFMTEDSYTLSQEDAVSNVLAWAPVEDSAEVG